MKVRWLKEKLCTFLIAGLCCCKNDHVEIETGLKGMAMPAFKLLLMDSMTNLNTQSIPNGQPNIFFYFSPRCPYCKAQTEDLIANIKSLKEIRFYFISSSPFEDVRTYYRRYRLEHYSNITVGWDYEMFFNRYFKAEGIPYLAIYNSEKKLKMVLLGKVQTDLIKDFTQK